MTAPWKVLLADDDPAVRESLRRLLLTEGYEVSAVASGTAALERVGPAAGPLHLALLDLNMPGKNGWATLDRLLEARPELPVVLLTGLSEQQSLAKAAGVRALVEKPIPVERLLELLRQVLAEPPPPGPPPSDVRPFVHLRPFPSSLPALAIRREGTPYTPGGLNE